MSETNIGELITDGNRCRDAIHVAVAPVTADRNLQPGWQVGFVRDDTEHVSYPADELIGIVDPFLTQEVQKGERFWLFLYPNTVTGMRHAWSHPAFKAVPRKVSE